MSKAGFRVLDSDLHVIEPSDLYDRCLDPAYRDRRRHARVLDRLPALRLALPPRRRTCSSSCRSPSRASGRSYEGVCSLLQIVGRA